MIEVEDIGRKLAVSQDERNFILVTFFYGLACPVGSLDDLCELLAGEEGAISKEVRKNFVINVLCPERMYSCTEGGEKFLVELKG